MGRNVGETSVADAPGAWCAEWQTGGRADSTVRKKP